MAAIAITFAGTYLGTKSELNQGTTEVKNTIIDSVPIKVGMDETGHGRLQDSISGSGVTVRGSGDSFVAKTMFDIKTGRKLTCIDLESTVSLFEDAVSGTEARIVFVDENGNEKQVTPLGGHFVDNEDSLQFGQGEDMVNILMSSNACNTAVETPPVVSQDDFEQDEEYELLEEDKAGYELDTTPAIQAVEDASVPDDGQNKSDGIFKRGLRRVLQRRPRNPSSLPAESTTTGASSPSRAVAVTDPSPNEVLARNRDLFAQAKIASQEGRKLQTSTNLEIICRLGWLGRDTCLEIQQQILYGSICTRSEDFSDGSDGDLTLDATTGELTLNGNPITNDSRFFDSTTLGTAHDVTTTFENINNFYIAAGQVANVLGTLVIYAKRIVIDGTLDGNGRGYPGAVATTPGGSRSDTYRAWSGTTPVCVVENEDRSKYREFSTVNHLDGDDCVQYMEVCTPTPRTPCLDEDGNEVNGGQGQGGALDYNGGGGAGHGEYHYKCAFWLCYMLYLGSFCFNS